MTATQTPPPREEHERKQRVLTRGTPSVTTAIADAVVIKDGDLFLMSRPDAALPIHKNHGFGLYYEDCRFLSGYELELANTGLVALGSSSSAGSAAVFQLTNPDLDRDGRTILKKEELGIRWWRRVDSAELCLDDRIQVRNWSRSPVELPLKVRLHAGFEDVYQVRGLLEERLGTLLPPVWDAGRLCFRYDGADRVRRTVEVDLPPGFERSGGSAVITTLRLAPRDSLELRVRVRLHQRRLGSPGQGTPQASREQAQHRLPFEVAVRSDNQMLARVAERGLRDLDLLRGSLDGREFVAAGVPWFATLFGRDSLIASLQLMPFEPAVAADTLRLLAERQGTKVDEWRDEQPGKILHELRVGEMAATGAIPHTPYYGTVDATPLFLIVLGEYTRWTGDLGLFRALQENVERALEWITRYGDGDGDGYIEYQSSSTSGLINQGWKDSGDAIVDAAGDIATPPIALVEVQAYAYAARRAAAALFRRIGEEERARKLSADAEDLRQRFDRDFWSESLGCYILGLEARKRPLEVVSSNAGHPLWTGIADPAKARRAADCLMASAMFAGWGVRTLSAKARAYNPLGYHLGTVWPHDNGILVAGLRRYGFDAEARRIVDAVVQASRHFEEARLPELISGFSRDEFDVPIRYPVACHPQAWAAGAVPHMLASMLGLRPDVAGHRLRLVRPILPSDTRMLEIRGLRLGPSTIGFRLHRDGDALRLEPLSGEGQVQVVMEAEPDRGTLV